MVEACSGIRSLLSLTFLSLVYGYFFENNAWIRVVLFVATIPIAIVANASRVTLTGVLTEYKPELAEGFFHTASGWVIFMVAVVILSACIGSCTGLPLMEREERPWDFPRIRRPLAYRALLVLGAIYYAVAARAKRVAPVLPCSLPGRLGPWQL